MNRAGQYLKATLSPEQWAEYKRQQQLDSQDSSARQRWRYVKRSASWGPQYTKARATSLAWLKARGYVTEQGQWSGLTKE